VFIEHLNLSFRHHVAAVGRRVTTLCKGEDGLRQQLALYQAYYNFCLPHTSLRQPLLFPEPTNGRAQRNRGGPVHRRWQRGSRIGSGRYTRYCCITCHRGHSSRRCKQRGSMIIVRDRGPGVPIGRANGLHQALGT
jgi:hypothetical protein